MSLPRAAPVWVAVFLVCLSTAARAQECPARDLASPCLPDRACGAPRPARMEPLWGLVITGATLIAATHLATVAITAALDQNRDNNYLYAPLAGPWLEMGLGGDARSFEPLGIPSGIAQLIGVALVLLGIGVRVPW